MTGPGHYLEAERLLTCASEVTNGSYVQTAFIAKAQVHATLALAAATALIDGGVPEGQGGGMRLKDYIQWEKVASVMGDDT